LRPVHAIWACLFGLSLAPAAAANPRESGLIGARSSALGGAVSADAEDCSASYYNPALIAARPGDAVCLDYQLSLASRRPSGAPSVDDKRYELGFGLVASGDVAGVPLGVGALFVLPNARLSRVRSVSPDDATWVLEQNRPDVTFVAFALSLQPLPFLSLGLSLNTLTTLDGGFSVTGTAVQPDRTGRTEYESNLRHSVDASLDSVRSYSGGALLQPGPGLSLALVYRQAARVEQTILGRLGGAVEIGAIDVPTDYQVATSSIAADYPRAVVLGARLRAAPGLRLLFDLTWEDYSGWRSPQGRTESALDLDLPPGVTLTLPEPVTRAFVDPEPRDRWVPRLGVEGEVLNGPRIDLLARGGYSYARSPLPVQTRTRWLDADRHTLSGGLGLQASERSVSIVLDVGAELTVLPERLAVRGENRARASGTSLGLGLSLGLLF
jgi:hypothetical protein